MKAYRVCNPNLTSYNNFQWKNKGVVSCNDYDGLDFCGFGLHAFKSIYKFDFTITNIGSKWNKNNKFLTLEVDSYVDLGDKIKFESCVVKKCENLHKFLESNLKNDTIKLDSIIGTTKNLEKRHSNIAGLRKNLILQTGIGYYLSGKLGSLLIFGFGKNRKFAIIDGKKYKQDTFYRLNSFYGGITKVS